MFFELKQQQCLVFTNKHSGEVFSWKPGFLTTTDLLLSIVYLLFESAIFPPIGFLSERLFFFFLTLSTSFPIGFFYCSEPIVLYSSISSSCSTEFKEPLSQSNTHIQEPLKHSDVHIRADPSSHTNLPSDHVINVLPNLVINAESRDIGCAFEVVSQVGGLATTTCIDTGSGINVISCQQLSCPGFEILN